MSIPNLAGIIEAKDVQEKGTGKFRAKYMAWAKVRQLLNEHAAGWEFHLRQSESSNSVWSAPDGTGFLVCYFKGPDNQQTADFPFPIMDYHNNPIKFSEISARNFTDSHRRALAACSAFTFSLGFELWAKEEIEENKTSDYVAVTQPQRPQEVRDPSKPVVHEGFGKRLDENEKKTIISLIRAFNEEYPAKQNYLMETYHKKWLPNTELKPEKYWSKNLHFVKQGEFIATLTDQVKQELAGVNF